MSHHESGPLGMFARNARNLDSSGTPEFCRFYTINDAMGNVCGSLSPVGELRFQVFDSFGNRIETGADTIIVSCDGSGQEFASTGRAQWRGAEGSQTDYNGKDIVAQTPSQNFGDWPTSHDRYTKETSGLVYMQNRYYDSETGRFTQPDPISYGLETVLMGQNNRWVYCANDPVNSSDPSGNFAFAAILAIAAAVCVLLFLIANLLSDYAKRQTRICGNRGLSEDWEDLGSALDNIETKYGILAAIFSVFSALGFFAGGITAAEAFGGITFAPYIEVTILEVAIGGSAIFAAPFVGYFVSSRWMDWVYGF